MVTGEKPDEQVDWSEVVAANAAAAAAAGGMQTLGDALWQIADPFAAALERLAWSIFGCSREDIPSWMDELCWLESEHAWSPLRGRARRRLASLRKQDRRRRGLLFRVWQREEIGLLS